jgi:hypothetical protein
MNGNGQGLANGQQYLLEIVNNVHKVAGESILGPSEDYFVDDSARSGLEIDQDGDRHLSNPPAMVHAYTNWPAATGLAGSSDGCMVRVRVASEDQLQQWLQSFRQAVSRQ